MRGLEAKRILITGGASGIGAATAARFLEEGSDVCILDRDPKAREDIRKKLPNLSGALAADVSNLKQVQSAFENAINLMGGVDVLINNAGISIRHNFLDITPDEWDKILAVNLTGVFYVAQTAARHMMEHDGGVTGGGAAVGVERAALPAGQTVGAGLERDHVLSERVEFLVHRAGLAGAVGDEDLGDAGVLEDGAAVERDAREDDALAREDLPVERPPLPFDGIAGGVLGDGGGVEHCGEQGDEEQGLTRHGAVS